MAYGDIVLWAVFGPVVLVALFYTVRAVIGWTQIGPDADQDYDYRVRESMPGPALGKERFVSLYKRVNGPRGATHVAVAMWAVLLGTPVIAKALEIILEAVYQFSGRSRVFEPGYLVWQFFIFFGLFAAWAGIAYLVARHYHKHTPNRFDDEIKDALNDMSGATAKA